METSILKASEGLQICGNDRKRFAADPLGRGFSACRLMVKQLLKKSRIKYQNVASIYIGTLKSALC